MKNEFSVNQIEILLSDSRRVFKRYGLFSIQLKLSSQSMIDKLNKTETEKKLKIPTSGGLRTYYNTIDSSTFNENINKEKNFIVLHFDQTLDLSQQLKDDYIPTDVILYDIKLNVVRQLELFKVN